MMQDVGVPCGPIYDMGEVFDDPQVKHLKMAWPMANGAGEFPVVRTPLVMSRTNVGDNVRLPTPELGEHTEEILQELGYDDTFISDLISRNVI